MKRGQLDRGLSLQQLATPHQPRPTTVSSPAILVQQQEEEQFVRRFVPDLIAERLMTDGEINKQELACYEHTVVGFFDVSGFSNLARQLEETEKRNMEKNKVRKRNANNLISVSGKGAEELVTQLNDTLTQLIHVIRTSGGDIIKFAGDAILVVWVCSSEQALRDQVCIATECAVRCCALRSESGLGLHVGIGCGQLVGAHVGGKFGRWEYFIAGEACTQSAKAEGYSKLDQVVVSPSAFALLQQSKSDLPVFTSEPVGGEEGFALVHSLLVSNEMLTRCVEKPKYLRLSDTCAKMAEGFVPGPVKEALKSSTMVLGGPRKLTVIFFLLLDVNLPAQFDSSNTARFLEECQSQAFSVQDSAYHYYATLRQFILDDKGFVAIVCLGLPPYFHEDNALRACKVARRLIKVHKVKAAAGICTGTVFCGIVGSQQRAEYSVAGSCINLAARLMCKAKPGEIWVDAQTRLEAHTQLQFDKLPSLPFKGFDQPVDIYTPVFAGDSEDEVLLHAVTPAKPKLQHNNALVGMETVTSQLSRCLFDDDESTSPASRIVLLEGDAGAGKTRLVEWAVAHSKAERNIVSIADASEINTPFFVFRVVLQHVLQMGAPSRAPPPAAALPPPSKPPPEKRKFFSSSSFRVASTSSAQDINGNATKKKDLLRRGSTDSVASLRRASSGDQLLLHSPASAQLEDLLQTVVEVSDDHIETEKHPYVLEKLQTERRLRGRRLSVLQQVLPNLATPPEPPAVDPLAAVDEEETSVQACIEVMLLVLEEMGAVETTLIVIENAHSMDKQSWELLRRFHASPATRSPPRVRFLVTYRPFEVLLDHALNAILTTTTHHPQQHASSSMHRVSSSSRMPSSPMPQRPPSQSPATATASLLSKTFHRFGDAKPFRSRHGSITSVASGNAGAAAGAASYAPILLPVEESIALRVQIPAFTLRETSQFLGNHFSVSTGPKLLQFLHTTSKGNARALLDCYRALQDQALITVDPESGIAEENQNLEEIGDLVFAIPQHLRAKLQQQFDQLPMQQQLLLKLASVVGATVSVGMLKQLCEKMNLSALDVDSSLQDLKHRGMLRPALLDTEDSSLQFENDNTRVIVYSQMLHTFRCQCHSLVLDVYQERPLQWRLREDPVLLANHAVGAEQPEIAFQCFQEAMRRAVLKDEPMDKGRRLWQSCNDVLDEQQPETVLTLAHRIVVEVLFAQIAISNSAWEEAKLSLTRALDKVEDFNSLARTNIPTLFTPEPPVPAPSCCVPFSFAWMRNQVLIMYGKPPIECEEPSKQHDVLWDPLENREHVDPIALVEQNSALAQLLLERIREYEQEVLSKANAIKTLSEQELGTRRF